MTAYIIKNFFFVAIFLLLVPVFSSKVIAAAPDGVGPWADSVLSSSQGLMKNGSPVPPVRSDPNSAVGVAEDNTVEGNFYSLGFGGTISLGFDNGISSGVILVEATNPGYPTEKVKVEVSENGTTWINAGEVIQDGTVNKPEGITCAKYVRITDLSNPADFSDGTADAYDIDGVQAVGDSCEIPKDECGGGSGCCSSITQTNKTNVTTSINAGSNTGKNKANKNTGSASVQTGNATTTVGVGVIGGTNTAVVQPCCDKGDTTINISGNGANSKNKVVVGKAPKAKKK